MNHRWPFRAVRMLFIFVAATLILGLIVMLLWNALIPDLFHGPALGYWQSVGLLLLAHLLLRGWGPWRQHGGWRRDRWRHRLEEKLAAMTPEERERFRKEWRGRCGWDPGHRSEETQTKHGSSAL